MYDSVNKNVFNKCENGHVHFFACHFTCMLEAGWKGAGRLPEG